MIITTFDYRTDLVYDVNQNLPVCKWTETKHHFSVEELGRILLTDSVPLRKICSVQPTHISKNVAFVVNLSSLDDHRDIRADENGVWRRMGALVAFVSILTDLDGTQRVVRRSKMGMLSSHYKLSRTYYRHSSSPDFSRIITTAYGRYTFIKLVTV
jgi:hypothetical protein